MKKAFRMLVAVLVWGLAGLLITATVEAAQSFLIVNNSGCIQYIYVKNINGKGCVNRALGVNADLSLDNAKGSGISYITAGPTKAIDDCCYNSKVKASVDLSGENWRIDIEPGEIKIIDRDNNYEVVFSASGNFSKCVSAGSLATGGTMDTEGPSTPRAD